MFQILKERLQFMLQYTKGHTEIITIHWHKNYTPKIIVGDLNYTESFCIFFEQALFDTTLPELLLSPRQFLIEESDGKTIYLEDWWSLTSSDNNEWPKKRPLKKALSERDVQLAAAMGLHDKCIEDPCGFFGWSSLKKGQNMRFWNGLLASRITRN